MSEKRSKYDTDPLDPEFARRTESIIGASEKVQGRATNAPIESDVREAPTRHFEDNFAAPYQSVFTQQPTVPPPPQGVETRPFAGQTHTAAPPPPSTTTKPTARTLPGLNLPENVALVLPYIPFFIGAVAAVVELLMLPRREQHARFHAAQGLALHLAVMAAGISFRFAGTLAGIALGGSGLVRLISFLFWLATTIFFIVSMVRVSKGEPHVIEPLKDLTRWLDDHIDHKK